MVLLKIRLYHQMVNSVQAFGILSVLDIVWHGGEIAVDNCALNCLVFLRSGKIWTQFDSTETIYLNGYMCYVQTVKYRTLKGIR